MSALGACLKKDLKLFFSSWTGPAALLLPVLLLFALLAGLTGDTGETRSYVEPFAVAVRDEDDTFMSRILIDQISRVDVISSVVTGGEKTDAELFQEGAAAVLTLPKDFFYTLYDMQNVPVKVILNEAMPGEAALFKSLVSSVIKIVTENQTACRALYALAGGEPDAEALRQLYSEASAAILEDALSRQQVFSAADTLWDTAKSKRVYYASAVCSLTLLFVPLCVCKGIPEERKLGVFQRSQAMGGSLWALLLSKFLVCLLLSAVPVGAVLLLLSIPFDLTVACTLLLTLLSGFSFFLFLSLLLDDVPKTQTLGNLLIIASLLLGGGLYPYALLPKAAQILGRLTVPYYTVEGFTASFFKTGPGAALWPLLLFSLLFLPGCGLLYRKRRPG